MKSKKYLGLIFIPLVYILLLYHPAATGNYLKLEVGLEKLPEIYNLIDVDIYDQNNDLIDVPMVDFLDDIYIFELDKGRYTLELGYEDQKKIIEFNRTEGYQKLSKIFFKSSDFDKKQSIFLYSMLFISTIFIFFTSTIINKEKNRFLRAATLSLLIIISLRIIMFGLKYYDFEVWKLTYKLSLLFEVFLGFSMLKWVVKEIKIPFESFIKKLINLFFVLQIGFLGALVFLDFGKVFDLLLHIKNTNIFMLFFIVLVSSREFLFPMISTIIFIATMPFPLKGFRKFKLFNEGSFSFVAFLTTIFTWYYTFHEFENGRIDSVVEIYIFLSVFILVLFKAYVFSGSREYGLLRSTFWWMGRVNYIVFLAYLYLIYTRDFKSTLMALIILLGTDLLYINLKNAVESQHFSLNHILFKESEILNISQLKFLIENEISKIIHLKSIHLKVNFDGIKHIESTKENIFFYGIAQEKSIIALEILPYYRLKIFERKAIEDLMNELPGVALRINHREIDLKKYSLDNFAIGTRLIEVKDLLILNNSISDERTKQTIQDSLLEELDTLIKEVDAHDQNRPLGE
ncbi:hypothetical protein [Psychrilyobacter atlanticus]|uniref:hypothetical protein n=1 Tax=Psychrilyobacter atlanticus TaxID=271091 RepID=UPI000411EBA7|nr:hypothetical protein [Psychrilyobacter atlanticus]